MIKSVILYRLGKELFEQCDIKSLEFVYQKLVSTRDHKGSTFEFSIPSIWALPVRGGGS